MELLITLLSFSIVIVAIGLMLWGITQYSHIMLELLLSICIIALSAGLSMKYLTQAVAKAKISEAFSLTSTVRVASSLYYSTHGELPNSLADMPQFTKSSGAHVKNWKIQDKSIVVEFKDNDYQFSLRPALAKEATYVQSIVWLCGEQKPPAQFQVKGRNHTHLPPSLLPSQCRH